MIDVSGPAAPPLRRARPMPVEWDWYQRAVFYEVLVQAFFDSNDDGRATFSQPLYRYHRSSEDQTLSSFCLSRLRY